jgi:BirA family biotin operon repressor/biotin-[acetyl-CoA-carboxylase] ligase
MVFSEDFYAYPLIHLTETRSTNETLSDLCSHGPVADFTVIQADYQSAGKGQRGNSWEAEAGQNLLFSFVFHPVFLEARRQFVLSKMVALAMKRTLDDYADDIRIKWPNDIYWRDRKLCGILIENVLDGSHIAQCVVGIGLNVNQEAFHSDAPNPVSLCQITGRHADRGLLLDAFMQRIQSYYGTLLHEGADALNERYFQALYRTDGLYPYRDAEGEFQGRILRVEEDGHLQMQDEHGHLRRYAFKEVKYRIEAREMV